MQIKNIVKNIKNSLLIMLFVLLPFASSHAGIFDVFTKLLPIKKEVDKSILVAGSALIPSTIFLTATAGESSGIVLDWTNDTNALEYKIYKKSKEANSWGSPIATVSGSTNTYNDASVTAGESFEYKVTKKLVGDNLSQEGYVFAGNKVALKENRGRVILVVDSTHATNLSFELNRLKDDLEGDGWKVARVDVDPKDTPVNIKSKIVQIYNQDRVNTSHVFLFGRVPVPYSGFRAYDGHPDHNGAWPADIYYGDIDGTWTDTQDTPYVCVYSNCASISNRNLNVLGDGRFDQEYIPSKVELAVGRVDFYDMPAFRPKSEKDLLRQYLNKDHLFRHGKIEIIKKGFTSDMFGFRHEQDAWKDFSTFFGKDGFFSSSPEGDGKGYLWSRMAGPGYYSGIYGGMDTTQIAKGIMRVPGIFNQLFGSYFGDWDFSNNLMRAFLADSEYGLTSYWAGFFAFKAHHMALGETIGYSSRFSQNINFHTADYKFSGSSNIGGSVAAALMGDPTLRLSYVLPPSNLVVAPNQSGNVGLKWDASLDTGLVGYHIYRSSGHEGDFVRLTPNPITQNTFSDSGITSGQYRYMVKAIKLEKTPSGSYYNSSQGIISKVSILKGDVLSITKAGVEVVPCSRGSCFMTESVLIPNDKIEIFPASQTLINTKPGEIFKSTYHYKGGPTTKNWSMFSFLVKEGGGIGANMIGANNYLEYPNLDFSQYTMTWSGGDRYEEFSFKTPEIAPGDYILYTGLYDGPDRLEMTNSTGKPSGTGDYNLSYEVARVKVGEGSDKNPPIIVLDQGTLANIVLPLDVDRTVLRIKTDESAICKYSNELGKKYSEMTQELISDTKKQHKIDLANIPQGSSKNYNIRCSDFAYIRNINSSDFTINVTRGTPEVELKVTALSEKGVINVEKGSGLTNKIKITKISGKTRPITLLFISGPASGVTYSFDAIKNNVFFGTCTPDPTCEVAVTVKADTSAKITNNEDPVIMTIYDGSKLLGTTQFRSKVVLPEPKMQIKDGHKPPAGSKLKPTEATLDWETDKDGTSEVIYGKVSDWPSVEAMSAEQCLAQNKCKLIEIKNSSGNKERRKIHSVRLVNLTPGTSYSYKLISVDANGQKAEKDGAFTTPTLTTTIGGGNTVTPEVLDGNNGEFSGYFWSSNVGWISLKGANYGLKYDTNTGDISGYASSSNIGWITFDPSGPYPRSGSNEKSAYVSSDKTRILGWARACSVFASGCSGALADNEKRGGWDGWISLNGTGYGTTLARSVVDGKVIYTPSSTSFAWGSNVIGWIKTSWVRLTFNDTITTQDLCPDGSIKPANGVCPTVVPPPNPPICNVPPCGGGGGSSFRITDFSMIPNHGKVDGTSVHSSRPSVSVAGGKAPYKYEISCLNNGIVNIKSPENYANTIFSSGFCRYSTQDTYTAKAVVTDADNKVASETALVCIASKTGTDKSFCITLNAIPNDMPAPMTSKVEVVVSGTATGNVDYEIYCDSDLGTKIPKNKSGSLTIGDNVTCTYTTDKKLKVIAKRGGKTIEATKQMRVTGSCPEGKSSSNSTVTSWGLCRTNSSTGYQTQSRDEDNDKCGDPVIEKPERRCDVSTGEF